MVSGDSGKEELLLDRKKPLTESGSGEIHNRVLWALTRTLFIS